MRFLVDAQLPQRMACRLSELGHEAIHVGDIGLNSATDADVWDAAVGQGAILVTKDQDFAVVRAARNEGPVIVWVRIGNSSNDVLITRFVGTLDAIDTALARGETIVELVSR